MFGVLGDKDARGIIRALAPRRDRSSTSRGRAPSARCDAEELGEIVREEVGDEATIVYADVDDALEAAREWAAEEPRRAVVVTGSIVLVGDAMAIADAGDWKTAAS